MANIDITKPLLECLKQFKGAPKRDNEDCRKKALEEVFVLLAKKLIYGGHLVCGNYEIAIQLVEFYYHEEEAMSIEPRIQDPIVYHRNGRYPGDKSGVVSPFPIMSLHAHTSGYDITFEDPNSRYRASALIRAFSVKDTRTGKFIKWNAKDKGDGYFEPLDEEFCDNRSQYLYYYLNGFQIDGNGNQIQWIPTTDNVNYETCQLFRGRRKNVYKDKDKKELDPRKWAFSKYKVSFKHENKDPEEFELLPS